MDIFEAMGTCRAIRRLKPDPVPAEMIERLIWAATRAPSPGNSQGWDFVVVDDVAKRSLIGEAIRAAMADRVAQMPRTDRSTEMMLGGVGHLLDTLGVAPVLIFVCGPVVYPPGAPREIFTWSAIYPAAQNLILAARALGLGSVFTTFHHAADAIIRETLGIPDDIRIGATIPIGWPDAPFGPVRRRPVAEFVHHNSWGERSGRMER